MASKTWTDATMTYVANASNAGPDWSTVAVPAWDTAGSMNGATGLVTYASPTYPAAGSQLLAPYCLLEDDATVPAVITMTAVRFQFSWTIVTLGPSGPTSIGNSETQTAVPAGGGSGSYDETEDPTVYFGGTDRATLFSSIVLWAFYSTGASGSESVTVSGFTVTVTYTTPATPQVISVTPSSGTVNGGQAVTIRGEGFTAATGVEFGGTAATSVVIVDDVTTTAVTPAHGSGIIDVEVLSVATGNDLYTYTLNSIRLPPMPTRTPMTQGGAKRRG